jgi:hypothetical protein
VPNAQGQLWRNVHFAWTPCSQRMVFAILVVSQATLETTKPWNVNHANRIVVSAPTPLLVLFVCQDSTSWTTFAQLHALRFTSLMMQTSIFWIIRNSKRTCTKCFIPCDVCTDGSMSGCQKCPSPLLLINGKCIESCPATHYLDTSDSKCKLCDPSCHSCSGPNATDCLSCLEVITIYCFTSNRLSWSTNNAKLHVLTANTPSSSLSNAKTVIHRVPNASPQIRHTALDALARFSSSRTNASKHVQSDTLPRI